MIKTKSVKNAQVTYDDRYNERWLDAVGENVTKFIINSGNSVPTDDTTGDPTQFTMTVVEVGAGTTTCVNNTEEGQALLVTTAANENDSINLQAKGAVFKIESGCPMYFGIKCKASEATQSDLLVGLCEVDTTLMAAHALAVTDDGVYFSCIDAVTTINFTNELGGVEGTAASAVALTTGEHIYEIYYDGSTLYAYVDDILVTSLTSGLADQALTPSVFFGNGDANARTLDIAWIRAIKLR